jgi:GT2 family glycosyltransferase/acetyltransferase-like isoleucine patch superfamily enzyme
VTSPIAPLPGPTPSVSVLLVTYNSAADLPVCLTGLQRQKVPGGYELICVDNASGDESSRLVAEWAVTVRDDVDVRIVRNEANVGYAAANNQAAALARGPVLLLLNPDCAMDDGCLAALVEHLSESDQVGMASALLRNADGSTQYFARRELSTGVVFWDLTRIGRRIDKSWRLDRGQRHRRYVGEFDRMGGEPIAVDCAAAACLAVWRDLASPRMFDASLPLFFNDGELAARIRTRCYRVEIVPRATAVHGYGTGHGQVDAARKRAEFVVSLRRYAAKRFPLRWCLLLNAILLFDAGTAAFNGWRRRDAAAKAHARGTLGGLWLPGGAEPWLSERPSARRRLLIVRSRLSRAARATALSVVRRAHRRRLIRRIRWQAWLVNAKVDVTIARSAEIAPGVRVEVKAGRRSTIRIGERVQVTSGVLLRIWGGTLDAQTACTLRQDCTVTVKGHLTIGPRVAIGRGAQVHADGRMLLGFAAGIAEHATVLDTNHTFNDVPTFVLDKPIEQADVTIEPFAFVGTNAVVTPGVTVGRNSAVGALSVVTKDVPPYTLVAGAPARPIREVDRLLERRILAGAPAATE